jgi:hypothetical protein
MALSAKLGAQSMAQDPLSHVASWITPTLDAGAGSTVANSSEERPATAEEWAAVEFEAVDAKVCQLLYKGMTTQETIMLRLASGYLAKSKPDLVSTIRKLVREEGGQDALFEFVESLSAAQKIVEDFAKCLGAAHTRLLIASAVIGFGEPEEGGAA